MMDPPKVLLETSFLRALCDPGSEAHADATATYLELVEQYEAERVLLVAVSDHLREFRPRGRQGPLAPVDLLHVGFQHRRVARRTIALTPSVPPDHALTLVMLERHRVRRVATLDPFFQAYDLELLPSAEVAQTTTDDTTAEHTTFEHTTFEHTTFEHTTGE
jgi:hypothetical protein